MLVSVSLLSIVVGGIALVAAVRLRKLENGVRQMLHDERKFAKMPATD